MSKLDAMRRYRALLQWGVDAKPKPTLGRFMFKGDLYEEATASFLSDCSGCAFQQLDCRAVNKEAAKQLGRTCNATPGYSYRIFVKA